MGDVIRRFEQLLHAMRRTHGMHVMATSPILENPPFGYLQQPRFYNAVLQVCTSMQPERLWRAISQLERRFKRTRSFKDAPRTLDIDIIFYDYKRFESAALCIPHRHWHERHSVLYPLIALQKSMKQRR